MVRPLATALLAVCLTAPAAWAQGRAATAAPASSHDDLTAPRETVTRYCAGCHDDRRRAGGFSWSTLDLADPSANAAQAEKVIRRVRAGLMPPAGAPRPARATLTALAETLETRLDRKAAVSPYAGAPELRRLNRTEYRNSVRDLLDLDVDVTAMLPADELGRGFDTIAEALSITPTHVQGYVRAASKISRAAIGEPTAAPAMTMYSVPKVVNQTRHVDGAPWGTRGGTAVVHQFPADGDYTFRLALYYDYLETLYGQSLPPNLQRQQIEVAVDGARVGVFTIDPEVPETKNLMVTPKIHVTAGPHRVAAAFVATFDGPTEDQFRQVEQSMIDISAGIPGLVALPHLLSMTVAGPYAVTGVSDTPSRRKIFVCTPRTPAEELPCAQKIVSGLARQAFRRPPSSADTETLMGYFKEGRQEGGFESGIRMAVQAVLASPKFLFRLERPAVGRPGTTARLADTELATRLAYFLWSAPPDDRLVSLAAGGTLGQPAVFDREVTRMLADTRASALMDNFAVQWLRLQNVKQADPDGGRYGNFTRNLGQSMTEETKRLFDSVLRENRSLLDLLTADYTFVDEVLAKHYGIDGVTGSAFRRVAVADPNRRGLLGHASVLTLTSLATRTSPVMRGKYVMEVLMGVAPPAPPPNVPPLTENKENEQAMSVRQRLAAHRANAACAACHNMMDPIGLSLENFDAIGNWRSSDSGAPVDPSGQLFDGTPLNGPSSLRNALLARQDSFVLTFTENLLSYGLGRLLDPRDMPTVRAIVRDNAATGYRVADLVKSVVSSVPFRMRQVDETAPVSSAPAGARP